MDDLPLKIPLQSITDFFSCPVCMCQLSTTVTTPCGHRFCHNCITDCINVHHKCPICNNAVTSDQLCRDRQFDELIGTVNNEKEKAEKLYFDALIGGVAASSETDPEHRKHFSPVEDILKKHLKESLVTHEKFYQQTRTEHVKQRGRVAAEYENSKQELLAQALPACDTERELERLAQTRDEASSRLDESFTRSTQLLAQAYDKYLSEHIPSMAVLPVSVNIFLLSKNTRISDVLIKPNDGLQQIKMKICEVMEKRGDKVIKFSDDLAVYALSSLMRFSDYELQRMCSDIAEHGASHPDIHLITDDMAPVLQTIVKPGCDICVYGHIQCESDLPKQCFATTFQQGHSVNYFTCKHCAMNWVCDTCAKVCHKGHDVVPYIMKHQPSWACCYCPKKKKCTLS